MQTVPVDEPDFTKWIAHEKPPGVLNKWAQEVKMRPVRVGCIGHQGTEGLNTLGYIQTQIHLTN